MKTCLICNVLKAVELFEPQRRQCIDCRKIYQKSNRKKYYQKTRDKSILAAKTWRDENLEKRKNARALEYARNAEQAKQSAKKYRKDNPAKINAWSRKHQAAKIQRTPAWLNEDDFWMIEQAYELAQLRTKMFGFLWHVDHIIPLQGKLVSGLHVPTNLQVIPATLNQRKNNIFVIS